MPSIAEAKAEAVQEAMEVAKSFDLVPLGSRLFVKALIVEKIGSLYLPETSDSKEKTEGVVISVGPDCKDVTKGDIIYYGRYSGFKFERDSYNLLCMNEEDVIAKVQSNG